VPSGATRTWVSRSGWLRMWIWITSDAATRRPPAFAAVNNATAMKNTANRRRISICMLTPVHRRRRARVSGRRPNAVAFMLFRANRLLPTAIVELNTTMRPYHSSEMPTFALLSAAESDDRGA
jgi:hypothetical protein